MTQAFADELAYFAESARCPQLMTVVNRLCRPVRVAVLGRVGVGRATVATALGRRGVVVAAGESADVRVLVIAEAVKSEDLAVLRSRQPALIVLTRSDLAGADPGGPLAVARRRADDIQLTTGVPTVPVVGLLAALEPLDDELIGALGSFVTEPGNLASVDAFLDDVHPVGREVRARLVERLDRFGIAHAVLALADGSGRAELTAHLQRLGNLDEVMSALDAAAAPVRYRRIRASVCEMRSLAVRLDDERIADLAAADVTVMAAMTAAVEVIETAGLTVDRRDTRAAHVDRALHWGRYGRGPVNALHRQCSAAVVTGSLRLAGQST